MILPFVLSPCKEEGYDAFRDLRVALWSQSPLPGHFSDPPRGELLALEFGPRAAGRMEKQRKDKGLPWDL